MAGTDILQGAVLLGLLALRQGGLLSIGALYAGTVLLGLCSAVFSPAASAIVPGIVGARRVPEAVAAGQAAANFCTIAGMLLGGALYRLIGIGGVLLLNALSNLAAAVMEGRMRVAPIALGGAAEAGAGAPGGLHRFVTELRDGLRQVRSDRTVYSLLLINTVFTLAVLPIAMIYMPYLFNVILGATPLQAAIPQAATWVGIILGSMAAGRLMRRHRAQTLIGRGLLVLSANTLLVIVLFGFRGLLGASWMSAACTAANAIAGAAGAFFIVPLYALFHARSLDEFRGRFWGLESCLRTAAMCAGYFAAGVLAQRLGLGWILAATAAVMLVLFGWVTRLGRVSGHMTRVTAQGRP
jgi:MFS family permease